MTPAFVVACLQTPAFALDQAVEAADYLLREVEKAAASPEGPDLILLPECAYPAYFLAPLHNQDLNEYLAAHGAPTTKQFCSSLAALAKRYGVAIAAGLALPAEGGMVNALVVWDKQGQEVARTSKLFLWHFDTRWFCAAPDVAVGKVDDIPVGLFVCADGRLPEIPRLLALQGAQLLLDATNWVTTGKDVKNLPNAQPDYLMRVRAMENQVYLAAANKVGREADTVVYCGKSLVVGPDGSVLAQASSDQPETFFVRIPRGPDGLVRTAAPLEGVVNPVTARRTGEYSRFAAPTIFRSPEPDPYVAVAQMQPTDGDSAIDALLANLEVAGASVILTPESVPGTSKLAYWADRSAKLSCYLLATGDGEQAGGRTREAWLLHKGQVVQTWVKGHLASDESGYAAGPAEPGIWESPWGRIGVMQGGEGLIPEVARGLALAGTELILWPNRHSGPTPEMFARARSAENRVFVALASPSEPGAESLVSGPDGGVMARTFPGARQGVAAIVVMSLARHKELVPDTDSMGGKRSAAFARLV